MIVPGSQGAVAELVAPGLPSVYRQLAPAGTTTGDTGQAMFGGIVLVTFTVKEQMAVLAGEALSLAVYVTVVTPSLKTADTGMPAVPGTLAVDVLPPVSVAVGV